MGTRLADELSEEPRPLFDDLEVRPEYANGLVYIDFGTVALGAVDGDAFALGLEVREGPVNGRMGHGKRGRNVQKAPDLLVFPVNRDYSISTLRQRKIDMTIDAGIRARVEASMCLTYGEAHPEGREEARISREDWDALLSTLRLVWNYHHEQMTPVVKQAVRETLALQ